MGASGGGGLQLNNVGKSFLLLPAHGLTEIMRADLRTQIQGDLNRYRELIAPMHRTANHGFQRTNPPIPSMVSQCWTDENYRCDGWSEYDNPDTRRPDGPRSWVGHSDDRQEC